MKLPLFGSNQNKGVDAARIELTQLRYQRVEIEASTRADIEDLVSTITRETDQIRLFQRSIIPQAETTVETSLTAYTSGQTSFLDLLDSERMLFQFKNELAESLVRRSVALARLEWISTEDLTTPPQNH